jgi:membrane protein DedA with SNARE-associated domain
MTAQLLALVFGTFVSEDLTSIAAGLLITRGAFGAWPATVACAIGIYLGDLGLWLLGRALGARALEWRHVKALIPPVGILHFTAWFEGHAAWAILGSRFAPGTRLPLYVAAGACRTSFCRFARWSLLAVAIWTPILVGVSALAGEHVAGALAGWLAVGRLISLVTAIVALVAWRLSLRLASRRGRQQLAASISRLWRWEFWPMWVFYAPVGLWTAWLALRSGGYRTLTAANPGMPDGGVVGESKHEILSRLPETSTIPSAALEPGGIDERLAALDAAMWTHGWTFPVVLKPDVGQRGTGVRLVRDAAAAAEYLGLMTARVVVQPYHAGPFEAGVFYYRMPDWPHGRILSITDKHFPAVDGDGRSTIEDLVWAHPRYRMQAATFLERLSDRRHERPPHGVRVPLGLAGNHAQGAMFTDGGSLLTPALEARIDEIARAYPGFFIGRFDIRYRSRDGFMSGRDLAIVELNGATAECTNIYDPSSSLVSAYRQLFRQWRLVFAIGAANRRLGREASSTERLLSLLRAHLTSSTPFPLSD